MPNPTILYGTRRKATGTQRKIEEQEIQQSKVPSLQELIIRSQAATADPRFLKLIPELTEKTLVQQGNTREIIAFIKDNKLYASEELLKTLHAKLLYELKNNQLTFKEFWTSIQDLPKPTLTRIEQLFTNNPELEEKILLYSGSSSDLLNFMKKNPTINLSEELQKALSSKLFDDLIQEKISIKEFWLYLRAYILNR